MYIFGLVFCAKRLTYDVMTGKRSPERLTYTVKRRIMLDMESKEKRNARQARYMQHNERISFVMPPGTKEKIKKAAEKQGISAAEYIRQAITEKLEGKADLPELVREKFND